jgi:hypothetical protein
MTKWSQYGSRKGTKAFIAGEDYWITGRYTIYGTTYSLYRRLSYYGWSEVGVFPTIAEARAAAEARHA